MKKALFLILPFVAFTSTARAESAVADGFIIQPRLESLTFSIVAPRPGVLVGYRFGDTTLGLGLAAAHFTQWQESFSQWDTLMEGVATLQYDFWKTSDGKVRVSGVFGVGYAQLTFGSKSSSESSSTGHFVPVQLGLGGDYFFHPNFGVGVESGYSGDILVGVTTAPPSSASTTTKGGLSSHALYGAIRVTLIIGSPKG